MTPSREGFNQAVSFITRPGITELLNWLQTDTDFYTAPASTKFHGNYEGGLLDHTMLVLKFALHNFNFIISNKPDLEYLKESVIISALFHDVCKTNYYKQQEKFRKNTEDKWEKYLAYVVEDKFPYGHGEKSVHLISKYMKLTDAEAMAIRWHMGATEMSVNFANSPQNYAYNTAIDHPLVRLIHCADMLSMTVEEKITK